MVNIYYRSVRDKVLSPLNAAKRGAYIRFVSHNEHDAIAFAKEYKLDEDLVIDGIDLYESPRIAREGENTYIFIRYCSTEGDLTSTYPLLIINTKDNILTVSRKPSNPVTELLKNNEVITTQKVKLILQLLDHVNEGYRDYLNGVTKQMFATRRRLQKTIVKNDDVLIFIDIEEDLNEFLASLQPYGILLSALLSGKYFKLHEDDKDLIEDLVLSTNELIDLTKSRLKTMQNIREAYNTIATNNLNRLFKRLTSISIFLMIPTVISGIYGMNVPLPLAGYSHAFTVVACIISALMSGTIVLFVKKKWL